MTVTYKNTNQKVEDGIYIARVFSNSKEFEFLTDNKAGTYSKVTVIPDVVIPPTPIEIPPIPPVITKGDTASLVSALMVAKGGEVIYLKPGLYGDFSISGKKYTNPVKIVSETPSQPAVFGRIAVTGVDNIWFESISLDWRVTADTKDHNAGFDALNTNGLVVLNCTFIGNPNPVTKELVGRGVAVFDSKNLVIKGCTVTGFRRGIMTTNVDGMVIEKNHVHNNRTSTLSGSNVKNIVVKGNHLESSHPVNFGGPGDHGDFIHYWTQPDQSGPSDNFVILDNFMEQGTGVALLGIYLDNNTNPQGFTNVLIENNVLHNGNGQGMRLEKVVGAVVKRNTLLQSKGDIQKAPRIRVETGCRDIMIKDNIVSNILAGGAVANKAALNIVETGTVQLANILAQTGKFVGLPKENGTLADMQQVSGAFPLGVGAKLTTDMVFTSTFG